MVKHSELREIWYNFFLFENLFLRMSNILWGLFVLCIVTLKMDRIGAIRSKCEPTSQTDDIQIQELIQWEFNLKPYILETWPNHSSS